MTKKIGNYCKAYLISDMRKFSGWIENSDNFREELDSDDEIILYLQEDYTVTHGIYLDENVIFNQVSDAWKEYCRSKLEFEIPDYITDEDKPSGNKSLT